MASPTGSGTSSGSTLLTNSGSEGGPGQAMDQRKVRRMQSNRESARRSRMRKQKLVDDLTAAAAQLRGENHRVLASLKVVTQQHTAVEAENAVLVAQILELRTRLQSLEGILLCMSGDSSSDAFWFFGEDPAQGADGFFVSPWSLGSTNQAVMASADAFQY